MKSIFLREDGTYAGAVYEVSHMDLGDLALMDAFPEPWVALAFPDPAASGMVKYQILDCGLGEEEVVRRVHALAQDADVKMVAALPGEEP